MADKFDSRSEPTYENLYEVSGQRKKRIQTKSGKLNPKEWWGENEIQGARFSHRTGTPTHVTMMKRFGGASQKNKDMTADRSKHYTDLSKAKALKSKIKK